MAAVVADLRLVCCAVQFGFVGIMDFMKPPLGFLLKGDSETQKRIIIMKLLFFGALLLGALSS